MRRFMDLYFIAVSAGWKWILGALIGIAVIVGILFGVGVIGGRIGRLWFPGNRPKTNAQCDTYSGGHSGANTPCHAVGGGRFGADRVTGAHGQRRCPSANAHSGDSEASGHGNTGTATDVDHASYGGSGG